MQVFWIILGLVVVLTVWKIAVRHYSAVGG
jgi:hypothetical protein